jgi:hypothetical protein
MELTLSPNLTSLETVLNPTQAYRFYLTLSFVLNLLIGDSCQ